MYFARTNTKNVTPFGSQKIFFDHIWKRLHPELTRDDVSEPTKRSLKKSATVQPPRAHSSEKRKSPPEHSAAQDQAAESQKKTRYHHSGQARSTMNNTPPVFDESSTYNPSLASPPIIHRSKMSSEATYQPHCESHPSKKDRCMIPKKRYLYSQGNLEYRPELPPQYPPPPLQHDSASYTDSDVSVAMILANGFGQGSGERPNTKNPSSDSVNVEEV